MILAYSKINFDFKTSQSKTKGTIKAQNPKDKTITYNKETQMTTYIHTYMLT